MSYLGPLQDIIYSYPYREYADDENVVAFFTALNEISQTYLDWFNDTGLAVYTLPSVSGPLLDWIGEGIYGIARPVFSSTTTIYIAGINSSALGTTPINGAQYFTSGTATIATDDYYKRVLTWWLYAGNGGNSLGMGRYFNIEVLRRKVARFLFGINGTDVTLAQAQAVSISPSLLRGPPAPSLSSVAGGTLAATIYGVRVSYVSPLGETLAGAASSLSVAADRQVVVASPPREGGAISYNVYANHLAANPTKRLAGLNENPIDTSPVNGSNKRGVGPMTLQNVTPIPIGTAWTEPTSGLVLGAELPTSNTSNTVGNFLISVPAGESSTIFAQAFAQGVLSFPFLYSAIVVVA